MAAVTYALRGGDADGGARHNGLQSPRICTGCASRIGAEQERANRAGGASAKGQLRAGVRQRRHYDLQTMLDWWPTVDRCASDLPVFYELLRRGIAWIKPQAG